VTAVQLVMGREPLPGGPSVFLAGPTPDRSAPVPSWRPEATRILGELWTGRTPLSVLSPESRNGLRADRYGTQVDWETEARTAATAILLWIRRDLRILPGMTTNVAFGLDVTSGRAVLGSPDPADGRCGPGPTAFRTDILAKEVPKQAREMLPAGAGAKGQRLYDWARIDVPNSAHGHHLPIRCKRSTGERVYYRCYSPSQCR